MPLILGYHRVVESASGSGSQTLPGMTVSRSTLRAHLEWVSRRFRIASLDELGARLERQEPCGQLAAVTFDDGYRDVHDYAMPLLQQMGVPAAVFVVTSLPGTRTPPLHDQLYQVVSDAVAGKRAMPQSLSAALSARKHDRTNGPAETLYMVRALLAGPIAELSRIVDDLRALESWTLPPRELATVDWDALASMHRNGMIIGSHTHTHAMLDYEDDATLYEELVRSRSELELGLGVPIRHFAYPDGRFDPRVIRAVAAAGYRFAYTICDHCSASHPLLTIPRVMLWEGSCTNVFERFSPSLMDCHATSVLPLLGRCRDDHGLRSRLHPC